MFAYVVPSAIILLGSTVTMHDVIFWMTLSEMERTACTYHLAHTLIVDTSLLVPSSCFVNTDHMNEECQELIFALG